MVGRLKSCSHQQFIICIAYFLTVTQTEILPEATAFSLCSISTDSMTYQSAITSDITHPAEAIEGNVCDANKSKQSSQSGREMNQCSGSKDDVSPWPERADNNNRDVRPRMLTTPLWLASGAALAFCKPGLR